MEKNIKGIKIKMSQLFSEDGKIIPVTIIKSLVELEAELINKKVVINGISKGKGFSGTMKKWGFGGQRATHGQSDKPRAPGSIGAQTPGRVFKGKKMAGRMGSARITIKGLKIVNIEKENNEIWVSGPVPGARNSKLNVRIIE